MNFYRIFIKPILFLFDAERVHHFVFFVIKMAFKIPLISSLTKKIYSIDHPELERKLFGLTFKNPVGLAAGFDKNATGYNQLSYYGFGFIEIGTVTSQNQYGNPKNRLFRLEKDDALINRMGFNNVGVHEVIENLKKNQYRTIIGGNISKNNNTLSEKSNEDYCMTFKKLHPYVDYFVLNISCPNVDGRWLEHNDSLLKLIGSIQKINNSKKKKKPILIKISPDLNHLQLDEMIDIVTKTKLDGIVASNTSLNKQNLKTSEKRLSEIGKGGISGVPIRERSTDIIRYLAKKSNKSFPIIGVGGIFSARDALEKLDAGADLIQIYTGFIYQGPSLIKEINKAILKNQENFKN